MAQTLFTDLVTLVSASWLNDVDANTYSALSAVSGTNTITATGPTTVTVYAANQRFFFTPANTNTGATTLNISSIGAKNIFLRGAALVGGEIFKSQPVELLYDGTQFNIIGNSAAVAVPRGQLAGLTMSTAGASATMTVAAGQAADSSNQVLMNLAASISKTTSAWALGSAAGGLDTGAIANSTWYHFYEIMRPDTGVVDVLFSVSASAPTMPASYTYKRRIGSGLTNGSAQWTAFIQDGDLFQWLVPVVGVSQSNPGTAAVLAAMTTPLGVNVIAWIVGFINNVNTTNLVVLFSDPATTDNAPDAVTFYSLIGGLTGTNTVDTADFNIRTNTSSQIRYRLGPSTGASDLLKITTKGWIDRRGRDS